jgi:hypothetical protein
MAVSPVSEYGEINVNVSLCLIKHHEVNKYGGVEIYFHIFLTSALDMVSFTPGHIICR